MTPKTPDEAADFVVYAYGGRLTKEKKRGMKVFIATAIREAVAERTKEAATLAKNWEPTEEDPGVYVSAEDLAPGATELDIAASISQAIRAMKETE